MREAFLELTKREKLILVLLLVVGYLFPLLGVITFFIARKKTNKTLLRYSALIGASLAMLVYIADYMYLLWT